MAKKATALQEVMTKTQLLEELAENTGLSKKEVASVLDELGVVIERHIKKRAVGAFILPGLLKVKTVKKPARKAQKGVPNPFRPGETMDIAAKPRQREGQGYSAEEIEGHGAVGDPHIFAVETSTISQERMNGIEFQKLCISFPSFSFFLQMTPFQLSWRAQTKPACYA